MLPFSILVFGNMSVGLSRLVIELRGRRSKSALFIWWRQVVSLRRRIVLNKPNQLLGIPPAIGITYNIRGYANGLWIVLVVEIGRQMLVTTRLVSCTFAPNNTSVLPNVLAQLSPLVRHPD